MKDVNEVLRKKEVDLQQLQREVEALRIAARLLSQETEVAPTYTRPIAPTNADTPPTRPVLGLTRQLARAAGAEAGYGGSWDAAAKKFP